MYIMMFNQLDKNLNFLTLGHFNYIVYDQKKNYKGVD